MSALTDAARAVELAADALRRELETPTEWVGGEHGATARDAARMVNRLIAAVHHHDAEIVRADTKWHIRYGSATDYAIRHAALIEPESPMNRTTGGSMPEVEVRFADGPTVRIARYSVATVTAAGLVVVEGFIASSTGQPRSGDGVRLSYLGIPGRGALVDVTASVELFSRLGVPHIRICTTHVSNLNASTDDGMNS